MEAPEKIYYHKGKLRTPFTVEQRLDETDVEYTRTDAFIEKALSWLRNRYRDYMYNPTGERLEAFFGIDMCNDFEKYMKGE